MKLTWAENRYGAIVCNNWKNNIPVISAVDLMRTSGLWQLPGFDAAAELVLCGIDEKRIYSIQGPESCRGTTEEGKKYQALY